MRIELFVWEPRCGWSVDFVGEDVFCVSESNGEVEPQEDLVKRLSFSTNEHGEAVFAIDGGGDSADRSHRADGDLAGFDEIGQVRQEVLAA
jgi:hypothetical protein